MPDLRRLGVGPGSGVLRLDAEGYANPECNSVDHISGTFTFEVTAAAGGAAASPAFVTADYVRELTVHFRTQFATACGPASVGADIALAQATADLVPNSGCTSD